MGGSSRCSTAAAVRTSSSSAASSVRNRTAASRRHAPPEGEVEVEGIAIPITRLERTAETAVGRLIEGGRLVFPVVIQATSTEPPDAPDVLTPVPVPDLGDGPHLSYAVQWFLFAAVAVIGYPLLLRRQAREAA